MKKKPSLKYYKNLAINAIYRSDGNIVEFYSFSEMGWVALGKESYLHKNLSYHEIIEISEKEAFIEIL